MLSRPSCASMSIVHICRGFPYPFPRSTTSPCWGLSSCDSGVDYGDTYSGTNSSSYYVENGSFLRLKNVVLGYTLPKSVLSKVGIQNLRLYVQAETKNTEEYIRTIDKIVDEIGTLKISEESK